LAISTEFCSAAGRSANSSHLGLRQETHLLVELAHALGIGQHLAFGDTDARFVRDEFVRLRNCTGWVATTGRPSLDASATEWRTCISWLAWPARCISM
jgi:hypothetical protein